MKKRLLFLTLLAVLFSGLVHAINFEQKKISVSYENEEGKVVLDDLAKKFSVDIFYNDQEVQKIPRITLAVENADLYEILDKCLKNTGLVYRDVSGVVVIAYKDEEPKPQAQPQRVPIRGKVVNEADEPIVGANVVLYPRLKGTVTNANGEFYINTFSGDSVLKVSFIGMQTETISLAEPKIFYRIVLSADEFGLNEVVVTGYGGVDKQNFTGTSTKVKGEELMRVSPNNIIQSLSVLDPSFRIVENSVQGSNPNALPEFYIRGRSGIGNTQLGDDGEFSESALRNNPNLPTFILDGYEVSVQTIYDLDPSLIKSIDILKDASSTAIYGSRAANGVVVIETTQPETGKLRVNYNMTGSVSAPDLSVYDLTNAREKLELERLAGVFESNSSLPSEQMKADALYYQKLAQINKGVETDWLAQPVQTAFSHKHVLRISGGDRRMLYGIDLVSDNTNGVMKESLRQRNSIGVSLSYRLENFQFKNKMEWQNVQSDASPYGNFATYTTRNPYDSFQDENGNYKQTLSDTWNLNKAYNNNPLYDAKLSSYDQSEMNTISNNFNLKWFITDHLYFQTQAALRYSHSGSEAFKDPASSGFVNKAVDERGTLSISNSSNFTWDANALLSFNRSYGKNHINSTLGTNVRESDLESSAFAYQGFPTGTTSDLVFAAKLLSNPRGGKEKTRLIGFFGMLNYTFNNIYLMDVSARFDGASQFGENNQFAPFWSFGTGINIHNYAAVKENMPWIDNLKVRATYGLLGNAGFSQNLSKMTYSYEKSQWYIDGMGATLNVLGNPDLKWERSQNMDLGLDIGLFKRLNMSLGYYNKITNNLIGSITIPSSTGFTAYKSNLGKVINKGYEIMARVAVVKGRNLKVNLHGSVTHNSNTIEEISDALKDYNQKVEDYYNDPGNAGFYSPLMRYYPGASLTSIYAMPSLGINPADGREIFVNKDGTTTYEWDPSQHVVVGDTEADVSGVFGFNLDYKGFFVFTAFNYSLGGQLMNNTLYTKVENANVYGNVDRRVFTERWQQPGDQASYKAITAWQQTTRATSRFVQDNNYLQFSSITLGYSIPYDKVESLGLSRMKFQMSMNDVARFSTIKTERGTSYPYARTVNFSLNVGF
ncbi:MAG: SusC/RagA family TonB-linked outer membrane protein [Draconibacterium sp.]